MSLSFKLVKIGSVVKPLIFYLSQLKSSLHMKARCPERHMANVFNVAQSPQKSPASSAHTQVVVRWLKWVCSDTFPQPVNRASCPQCLATRVHASLRGCGELGLIMAGWPSSGFTPQQSEVHIATATLARGSTPIALYPRWC
ncbi:unnamed protein product [Boreogadus saida]